MLLIWLSGQGRGGALRRPGGRGQGVRRDRGRGRGRGGAGRGEKVSADDLDADLEKYHAIELKELAIFYFLAITSMMFIRDLVLEHHVFMYLSRWPTF